jgi:hypothetical protein
MVKESQHMHGIAISAPKVCDICRAVAIYWYRARHGKHTFWELRI